MMPTLKIMNRLRHSDYVELLEKNGFKVIKTVVDAEKDERTILEKTDLSYEFRKYDFKELLMRGEHFIVIKD